ncbi:hypothetical protein [Streptomyces sp. NPDC058657]|uniref:hypothetical protein n=1 Tax=unclassified Streptomyces TaxID=2593676 RepID=UPI00365831D1
MSLGEDDDRRGPDDPYTTMGGTRQTRTRMPDDPGSPRPRGSRPGPRASRSMITVVAVVVLLIAAIAFANRGPGSGPADKGGNGQADKPSSESTAATGERPVQAHSGALPSGYAHNAQGAQSAAANFAVALVSADILKPDRRREIVPQVFVPAKVDELQAKFDAAYDKAFLDKVGLDAKGNAGKGRTYVSRTAPVGTKVTASSDTTSTVEVWCTGVFGTAGGGAETKPVTNDWFTMVFNLQWSDNDWKVESYSQREGPAPVNADRRASDADAIAKAVEEYGGFTYAR